MRTLVLPYRAGSNSARTLSQALGGQRIRLEGSRYQPRRGDTVVNWGNASPEFIALARQTRQVGGRFLNSPESVANTVDKGLYFETMHQNSPDLIPRFWRRAEDIPDDAFPVVCRTVLRGSGGAGIVIADTRAELVRASLYVEYKRKLREYRVHVGRQMRPVRRNAIGQPGAQVEEQSIIISVQQKRRRNEDQLPAEREPRIRNLENGYVFCRENVQYDQGLITAATDALDTFNLDFGAVDVIYNQHEDRYYALEINTAPGLEGQTVEDYKTFFEGI